MLASRIVDPDGPFGVFLEESGAHEAQRPAPGARVAGALDHGAALAVCGDDEAAKSVVPNLASSVTGQPGLDAAALRLSCQFEPLTAVLISINKRYEARSGIAVIGIEV